MEWFLYVRAIAVGAVWGGTVYLMLAFLFMFFPLPTYFRAYTSLRNYAQGVERHSPAKGILWYDRRVVLMRALAWLLWLAIVGLYAYSFKPVLSYYIIESNPDFWNYYAAGLAFPSLWLLARAWITMRRSAKKEATLQDNALFDRQRPLLDRIAEGEKTQIKW